MSFAAGSVREWACPPVPVDAARLLRVHKYTNPDKVRPAIREAAENAVMTASRLSAPMARYVITEIESIENGTVSLSGGVRFTCPAFDDLLAGCERLLAFVMTLGPELDARTMSLVEDQFEPLDALFLEASGWLTIEAVTRKLASQLKQDAAKAGWRLSMRMGPGYEYRLRNSDRRVRWELTEQAALFRLFRDAPLPITLMSSCAMQPKMSRSGIYGLTRVD